MVLDEDAVDELIRAIEAQPGYRLEVDLEQQTVTRPDGEVLHFDVEPFRKQCMLEGLDEIGLTLQRRKDIEAYEERRRREAPWLFGLQG